MPIYIAHQWISMACHTRRSHRRFLNRRSTTNHRDDKVSAVISPHLRMSNRGTIREIPTTGSAEWHDERRTGIYNLHRGSEIEDKERINFPSGGIANWGDYWEFHRIGVSRQPGSLQGELSDRDSRNEFIRPIVVKLRDTYANRRSEWSLVESAGTLLLQTVRAPSIHSEFWRRRRWKNVSAGRSKHRSNRRWQNEEEQVAETIRDETRDQKRTEREKESSGREKIRPDKPTRQVDATRCEEIREDRCKI